MNVKLFERLSIALLIIGLLVFFTAPFLFTRNTPPLDYSKPINTSVFDNYGSFISGVVGTIFSLASVILFYVTLKEQRKDILINQKTSEIQVKALEQQIEEFELQRKELEQTREVFLEQTLTQRYQRFENTFFQLLNVHTNSVESMMIEIGTPVTRDYKGRQVLEALYNNFFKRLGERFRTSRKAKNETDIIDEYERYFLNWQSILGHYFRYIYHILKFVNNAEIADTDKRTYTNILRAQLSSYELIMIYYNGLSEFGSEKSKPLYEKYSMLKNMDEELIIDGYKLNKDYEPIAFGRE